MIAIRTFCIYKHTSPSGKIYIGLTSQKNPNRRWNNGEGYRKQPYFYKAIQKYGWDNIKHEILEDGLAGDEVEDRERYWIAYYKSDDEAYGYNLTSGGYANKCLTKRALKNLSLSHMNSQGKSVLCLETGEIYPSSAEASRRLFGSDRQASLIRSCCRGDQYTFRGLHWCFSDKELPEPKRKSMIDKIEANKTQAMLANSKRKATHKVGKRVKCLETNITYDSIRQAARETGTNKRSIQRCLSGDAKSAGRDPSSGKKLHWQLVNE